MPLWSNATISRFAEEAERLLALELKLLVDRYELAVVSGTSSYVLPNYIWDIRQVKWQGKTVYPRRGREMRNSTSTPLTSYTGTPRDFVFSDLGQKTIRFYPTPNVSISAGVSPWTIADIQTRVIIEHYRAPDFNETVTNRVASWMYRQIIKDYVLARCMEQEGKGQDVAASRYFNSKWESNLQRLTLIKENLSKMKPYWSGSPNFETKPERPQLPDGFGVRVY